MPQDRSSQILREIHELHRNEGASEDLENLLDKYYAACEDETPTVPKIKI